MQHILGGIVVHVAELANVPVSRCEVQFGGIEHSTGFFECPGEVVAVVIEIDIGILRSVESAPFPIGHHPVKPGHDLLRRLAEVFTDETLEAVHIVAQEFGVVVEHFFEMRNNPALVHAISVKAAGKLIVNATASHLFKGHGEGLARPGIAAIHRCLKKQIEDRGMRKLGL